MLAAALLAAVPSAAAVAVGSGDARQAGGGESAAAAAAFPERLVDGPLTFPIPDAPGPATLAPGVEALVDGADPGRLLDVVVTLDRPADRRLTNALDRLGVWTRTFEHLPSAAVRLPVARLGDLQNLRGVLAIYDNKPLQYFLKDSAKANNVERAWNALQVTGKGVTVAIIDTGVDFTHPDLAPAMKANVKIMGFGQDPVPTVVVPDLPNSDTSSGHGTHVAGDVAGRGTASGGDHKGMAYGADLVGIGTGDGLSIFTALEGFEWLLENREKYGIRVVNNSYGLGFGPYDPMDPINLASKRATDAGVVVVFANGNDGDEMSMNPYATAPWVLPVAAGTKSGNVTDFSSGGIEADTVGLQFGTVELAGETRKPLNMGLYHPAITATGQNVVAARSNTTITPLTSAPDDVQTLPPDQLPYYHTLSGTSMAAPEAAGIVALLLEANPALTPQQVRMVLQVTARPIADAPFYKQGYGYTDASAATELAKSLNGLSVEELQSVLEAKQAARDQAVLDTLAHPARTYGYTERAPFLLGKLTHKIDVAPASERVKIVTNGGSLPFLGLTSYDITVTDAAGKEVGSTSNSAASGTTALDLELRKLDVNAGKAETRYAEIAWGQWTVEVGAVGTLVPPMDTGQVDDAAQKRWITTLISVFGADGRPCEAVAKFVPRGTTQYRFQDDKAPNLSVYPADPEFTYVGPLPDGSLGNRHPERKLAATFGQATTTKDEPQFTTLPLAEPVIIGGDAQLKAYIQGPSEAVAGLLQGDLIDVKPDGSVTVIGKSKQDVAANSASTHPTEVNVPIPLSGAYTVPAGHQIGVRLHLTFVGTSAHTLFYDSTKYPSGVSFQTGEVIKTEDCALVNPGTAPAAPVEGDDRPTADTAPPTTTTTAPLALPALSEVLPALPEAIPAVPLDDLAPLDQVGQEGLELVTEIGAVEGQLDGRPQEVDLLPDVVAPRLEGIAENRLRL
jgi:serine protease AprX